MKSLEELTTGAAHDSWPDILEEFSQGAEGNRIIPVDPVRASSEIVKLQMTIASYCGAAVFNSGGLLFGEGLVRLYGSGSEALPSIAKVNGLTDLDNYPGSLVIGYDVFGGVFALDGGGLGIETGSVCYFGVDTLEWESLGLPYSDFLSWLIAGQGLEQFYSDILWADWRGSVASLQPDQGFSLFPPPSTTAWGNKKLRSISPVPLLELGALYHGMDVYSL